MRQVIGIVVLLVLASCSPQLTELEKNESLWASEGPSAYQYRFQTGGFLPPRSTVVTVRDDAVSTSDGQKGHTIEALFDDVRTRLESDCEVEATYDPALGYPLNVRSDCGEEGDGWSVAEFETLE